MTQEKAIFRRQTSALGGPLSRDLLPTASKIYFDELTERAEDLIRNARAGINGLPPIHFDFIVNSDINAIAFRANNRYFIGIYTGLVYMLRLVIGRMLSDARVFPSIGDPDTELKDLVPLVGFVLHADALAEKNLILTPRDPVRGAYAHFLLDQAMMFFIGHEIAHISRGHVDYLLENRETLFSSEISEFAIDEVEVKFERQCLEQDADRRSIISRIDSLRITHQDEGYRGLPWAKDDMGAGCLIQHWGVALGILFRIFGDTRFTHMDLSRESYPPIALRRLYSEICSAWQIDHHWDSRLHAVVMDAFNESRNDTEHSFATILGQPVSWDGFREAMSPSGMKHAMDLQDYWNTTMVAKLRPYSYEF